MIKALLIDDEEHCLDTLSMLLEDCCPEVQILDKCASATEALKAMERFNPALVFLDVEMPGMNGFEMLELFSEIPFAIIFTTSYDQYAIKAFRFNALDYLLKPIDPNELIAAVHKVKTQKYQPLQEQFQQLIHQMEHKETGFHKVAIPKSDGFELIEADQIVRCEADDNYTHVFLKNKSKVLACRSLKEIESQLHHFSFFLRVHHSYLVNLNEVTKYVRGEGGYVIMSDGSSVSVSKSRKEALLRWF